MKQYVAGFPAGRGRARPAAVRDGRVVDARQPARDQGAERRPAGGAHRHEDAGAGDEGRAARSRPAPAHATSSAASAPARASGRSRHDAQRRAVRVYGWLLLLPALVLLVAVHALSGGRDPLAQLLSRRRRAARPPAFVGLDNYRALVDDPVFWQALSQQPLVRARHDPAVDRARAADGAVGQRAASPGRGFLRLAYFTPTVLPMIAVANIWLFFYTPRVRPARAGDRARSALAEPQLARQQEHGARRADASSRSGRRPASS